MGSEVICRIRDSVIPANRARNFKFQNDETYLKPTPIVLKNVKPSIPFEALSSLITPILKIKKSKPSVS